MTKLNPQVIKFHPKAANTHKEDTGSSLWEMRTEEQPKCLVFVAERLHHDPEYHAPDDARDAYRVARLLRQLRRLNATSGIVVHSMITN